MNSLETLHRRFPYLVEWQRPTKGPWQRISGVYFLVCNSRIVYIGRSEDINRRIISHSQNTKRNKARGFSFDKAYYVEEAHCGIDGIRVVEYEMIGKMLPKFNISGNRRTPQALNILSCPRWLLKVGGTV